MADHPFLGPNEAEALALAASLIEAAQGSGASDPEAVARALEHNLAVWRSLGEAVVRTNGTLSPAVRSNLDKLGALTQMPPPTLAWLPLMVLRVSTMAPLSKALMPPPCSDTWLSLTVQSLSSTVPSRTAMPPPLLA